MNNDLSPVQALFLWKMLTAETADAREPTLSAAVPKLSARKQRAALLEGGFLTQDKRGRTTYLSLTDKAWAWAEASLDVELPGDPAAQALQGLLRRLLPFLRMRQLPLASLFANDEARQTVPDAHSSEAQPKPKAGTKQRSTKKATKDKAIKQKAAKATVKKTPVTEQAHTRPSRPSGSRPSVVEVSEQTALDPLPLMARVEQACLDLADGRRQQRVRLRSLRRKLNDVSRSALDQTLLDLQDAGRAVLYRDDNTAALTAEDHDAALVVGNAPRHLVYLEA